MAEPTVQVTEYTVSVLPGEDINRGAYEVRVAYRGAGRWAVLHHGYCLDRHGDWGWESIPSERTDQWLAENRFTEDEALRLARGAAPHIRVNGMTAAEVQEWARRRRDPNPHIHIPAGEV